MNLFALPQQQLLQRALAAKLAADVEAAEGRIAAARTDALAHVQQVANDAARATTARLG